MNPALVYSRALAGAEAPEVAVEVHLANGLPAFLVVGLPDTEVKESRERVRAALLTAGFEFPARKIVVSLAPADLPKASGRFDLPIALGILAASGQLADATLDRLEFAGELSLSGALRPVRGALAMARAARRAGRTLVLPPGSAAEAALVAGVPVLAAPSLLEVCAHLEGSGPLAPAVPAPLPPAPPGPDLRDIRGQLGARRALEVAAAGGHSLLLMGPPGVGKSMLASRLTGILPPMSDDEALESAALQALSSDGFDPAAWKIRPLRAPHHSVSVAALIGGGSDPRPGEVTLAHLGVLFLDELPHFQRRALESLREPLERGEVLVSRVAGQYRFPARFQLVAAMNPCPCGYLGHPSGRCHCTPEQVARYRGRLSGPLLDRIDLQVEMAQPAAGELLGTVPAEDSAAVRDRVVAARARQLARQGLANAELGPARLERDAQVDPAARALLAGLIERLALSARATHRMLRVARTVADLAASDAVAAEHVLQAVQMRRPASGSPSL